VIGKEKVVRYLLGLGRRPEAARMRMTVAGVNVERARAHHDGDHLRAILVPEVVGDVVTALRWWSTGTSSRSRAKQLT
jgi:hypothetical protein